MAESSNTGLLTEIERDLLDGKPVADVLRKLVILGGRAGSRELREWATLELRGYGDVGLEALPAYRKVPAVIQVDAVVGLTQVSHMSISADQLPEVARPYITNEAPFTQGIGEIETLATRSGVDETVRLALPMERKLAQMMDASSPNRPHQQTNAVYWSVSRSAVSGHVDQVRTRLAELLGELRSAASPSDMPSAEQASNAVQIVVHGKGARVNVAHATTGAEATVGSTAHGEGPFWTLGRRIGAAVVGLATLAAAVIAWLQLQSSI